MVENDSSILKVVSRVCSTGQNPAFSALGNQATKSTCTTRSNARATWGWKSAASSLQADIPQSFGSLYSYCCRSPPTPCLSLFSFFPEPIALYRLEPCMEVCVCIYTIMCECVFIWVSRKTVLSCGSLHICAFVFSLYARVHTRCCEVQSLCGPSTDT